MEKLDSKPISCKMFVSNQFGVFMMPPYHPGSPSGEGAGRTKKVKINCIFKKNSALNRCSSSASLSYEFEVTHRLIC
jgi:hypothetical protein